MGDQKQHSPDHGLDTAPLEAFVSWVRKVPLVIAAIGLGVLLHHAVVRRISFDPTARSHQD